MRHTHEPHVSLPVHASPTGTHCILHEFYTPFQHDLNALLTAYGLPLMEWSTERKGARACPSVYRHWPLARMSSQTMRLPYRTSASSRSAQV